MKPEVLSALHDYEEICKNPWRYKPSDVQELVDEWLDGYIIPKEWVIVECLESAKDFKEIYVGEENKGPILRVHIYGGVYKVTDEIIGKEFILDMDKGVMINGSNTAPVKKFMCLTNTFLCDYSDYPNILLPVPKDEKRIRECNRNPFEIKNIPCCYRTPETYCTANDEQYAYCQRVGENPNDIQRITDIPLISTQPRSGKVLSLNESLIKHAMEHPNTNNVFLCPPPLIDSEFINIKRLLNKSHICYKADDENKIITLTNDSSIHFKASTTGVLKKTPYEKMIRDLKVETEELMKFNDDMIEGFSNNPVAQRYFKKWRLNEKKEEEF